MTTPTPYLDELMGAYFHQDYMLIAETIEGLIEDYLKSAPAAEVAGVRQDIDRLRREHADDLDEEFLRRYGFGFDPKLWDLTAEAFLSKLDALLGAQPAS